MDGKIGTSVNLAPLKKLASQNPRIFNKAMKKGAIQFLNWANNGSSKSSRKPPIRWGVLRGSSSAFVGGELVDIFTASIKSGAKERPTPAESHTAPPTTITWVWNTDYAAKMHEWAGGWGTITEQDGDAGAKWVEEHLKSDRDDLIKMIAEEYKSEAGM